jgi:hypothetical protein
VRLHLAPLDAVSRDERREADAEATLAEAPNVTERPRG